MSIIMYTIMFFICLLIPLHISLKGSSNWMVDALQSHTSDLNTSSPACLRWSFLLGTSPWRPWNSAPRPPVSITMPSLEFPPWRNSVTDLTKRGPFPSWFFILFLHCAFCFSRLWYEGFDRGSLARWRNWRPRQTEAGGRGGITYLNSLFALVKKIKTKIVFFLCFIPRKVQFAKCITWLFCLFSLVKIVYQIILKQS